MTGTETKELTIEEFMKSFDHTVSYLSLNKNNRNVKLFLNYASSKLIKISQNSLKKFFYVMKHIHGNPELKKLFIKEDKVNITAFIDSNIFKKELLIKYNKRRLHFEKDGIESSEEDFDNVYMKVVETESSFQFVKDYLDEERSESIVENTSLKKYTGSLSFEEYDEKIKATPEFKVHNLIGVEPKAELEFSEDYIIPNQTYNFRHLVKNLQDNKNVLHLFNHSHPMQLTMKHEERLQRCQVRVNNYISETALDIEYSVECGDCAFINKFNRFELSGTTRCNSCNSMVKTPNASLTPNKQITLREYDLAFRDKEDKDWDDTNMSCFSLVDLNSGIEEVEFILLSSVNDSRLMSSTNVLIVSKNSKLNSLELDRPIINTAYIPKKKSVIEHVYDCLVKYLQEEHNLYVTDQHKVPNITFVFSSLANFFHDIKMLISVAGYSGSGKSFLIENIMPLLHFKYANVSGGQVSKSKYLGGKPEVTSSLSNARFAKGVVGTNTVVCVEEFTTVIDKFNTDTKNRANNIVSMEKEMNDFKVKMTTHGTKEYPVTASRLYVGNLDVMKNFDVYRELLRREYRKISKGKRLSPSLPLYKSIEWYSKNTNRELAQAQYNIRSGNLLTSVPKSFDTTWDFLNNHYAFHLPPAEMARFHYAYFLEEVSGEDLSCLEAPEDSLLLNKRVDTTKLHTKQLHNELKEMFTKVNVTQLSKEEILKYASFFKQVEKYIKKDYLLRRNNMRFADENLNTHVVDRLMLRAKSFFLLEKQARGDPLELTSQDKDLFEDIELYNYNGLSVLETAKKSKPYVNDSFDFDEEIIADENIQSEEVAEMVRVEEEKEMLKMIETQSKHDADVFEKTARDDEE